MRAFCKIYKFIMLGFGTLSLAAKGLSEPATKEVEKWREDLLLQTDTSNSDKQNIKGDKNKIAGDLRRAFDKATKNG